MYAFMQREPWDRVAVGSVLWRVRSLRPESACGSGSTQVPVSLAGAVHSKSHIAVD